MESATVPTMKLAYVLPPVQVVLAGTFIQWGLHSHPPPGLDTFWAATPTLICYGINVPAYRLSWMLDSLLYRDRFRPELPGFYFSDWLFLIGVAILWYLIGTKIDTRTKEKSRTGKIFWNLLAALYGFNLLIVICLHNVIFTDPRTGTGGDGNFLGDLIFQGLWFIWSLALIIVPGRELAGLRRKPSHPIAQD